MSQLLQEDGQLFPYQIVEELLAIHPEGMRPVNWLQRDLHIGKAVPTDRELQRLS
jgi:hypothetical protein